MGTANPMAVTTRAPNTGDQPEPGTPSANRWLALTVVCLSVTVIVLDNTIMNVALPSIERSLNASASQQQWVVDAYTLVFAALLLTAGTIGDRFGRRGTLSRRCSRLPSWQSQP
jgi:MFS family permease